MERRAFVAFVSSGAIGTAGCTDEDVQKITDPLYSTRFQPGTVYEMDINRYPRFSGEFTHTIDTPVHAL